MDDKRHVPAPGRTLLAAITVLFWLLPGCDRGSPVAPEPGTQKASSCDLLSVADLQSATNMTFKIGTPNGSGMCRFESQAQNAMGLSAQRVLVRINRYGETVDDAVASYTDMMRKGMGSAIDSYRTEPVPGVGDRALWERYSDIRQLAVFKTDGDGWTVVLVVGPDGFDDNRARDVAIDLAARALQRLQRLDISG